MKTFLTNIIWWVISVPQCESKLLSIFTFTQQSRHNKNVNNNDTQHYKDAEFLFTDKAHDIVYK